MKTSGVKRDAGLCLTHCSEHTNIVITIMSINILLLILLLFMLQQQLPPPARRIQQKHLDKGFWTTPRRKSSIQPGGGENGLTAHMLQKELQGTSVRVSLVCSH